MKIVTIPIKHQVDIQVRFSILTLLLIYLRGLDSTSISLEPLWSLRAYSLLGAVTLHRLSESPFDLHIFNGSPRGRIAIFVLPDECPQRVIAKLLPVKLPSFKRSIEGRVGDGDIFPQVGAQLPPGLALFQLRWRNLRELFIRGALDDLKEALVPLLIAYPFIDPVHLLDHFIP